MVAQRSFLVPASLLIGASCQLSHRPEPLPTVPAPRGRATDNRPLTSAEQRVLELLLRGYSNKEIASVLGRAEPTIKNQVASILRKHGVPSRARLIALLR